MLSCVELNVSIKETSKKKICNNLNGQSEVLASRCVHVIESVIPQGTLACRACAQETLSRVCACACLRVPSAPPRSVSAHPISATRLKRSMHASRHVTRIPRVRTTVLVCCHPQPHLCLPLAAGLRSWSVISAGGHRSPRSPAGDVTQGPEGAEWH